MVKLNKGTLHEGPMSEQEEDTAQTDEAIESTDEEEPEEIPEPTLEELLAQAEAKAEAAEKEISYRDAEIQNIQRRMAKEKSELIQYSSMNLSRRFLSVLDDIDRALKAIPEDMIEQNAAVVDGMTLMRDRIWSELKSCGVSSLESKGKDFDPNLHEAITTIPADEQNPSGKIIDVIEEGYMFKEKLLRAAKVVVTS